MTHCVSIPMIFVSAIFARLITNCMHTADDACDTYCQNGGDCSRNSTPYFWWNPGSFFVLTTLSPTAKFQAGLVTWPFCGQITRFWLFYFLFGLEKNVWPFGSILAFLSSDRNFHYFLV